MSGRFVRQICTAALIAGAVSLVLPAPQAGAAPADPPDQSVSALLSQLQTLYRKAEEATERYNATDERLKQQREKAGKLGDDLATTRIALADARKAIGQLAREQYQGGSGAALSPYLGVMLSDNPQQALDQGHQISRAAGQQAATVKRLEDNEKKASALAAQARDALNEQQALAARQKQERDTVVKSLDQVEKMLASLNERQLAELQRQEAKDVGQAQDKLLASGRLSGAKAPSSIGSKAVEFAYQQLGKPYVWGAAGPDSFDCSGLTSQAWARAGAAIPRTSQEQWQSLPKVGLDELRPGDLVIYFEGATHVALYIGDGLVIQAPRPGAYVKVSPIASNPLLGAVRPDAGRPALSGYVPPRLPEGARSGSDAGYGSASAPGR
ncbi:NlpC/P60 family protein [Streptomyces gamaensis]|uniref:NlpC/P60 family protein n=1 Tax=Streptomyces gamaensis TaxID=1763542 RepID=A0ABW0Z1M1_9ACTN